MTHRWLYSQFPAARACLVISDLQQGHDCMCVCVSVCVSQIDTSAATARNAEARVKEVQDKIVKTEQAIKDATARAGE